MSAELKFFLYRFFAVILAFAELCCPILGRFTKALNPSVGEVTVIAESGAAARVYPLANGDLLSGYETEWGIMTALSSDGGKTWRSEAVAASFDGLDCANINFYQANETVFLAYRATATRADGSFYSSLRVSESTDDGHSWGVHSIIAENTETDGRYKGLWKPFIYEINGELVCFYANDSTAVTDFYQNIERLSFDGEKWCDRKIISEGKSHDSRDGMPVLCRLSKGGYALAIESTRYRKTYPFIIQLLYSKDGETWSEPKDIYIPKTEGSKAGAPGICETADGRIAVTFQTDEDTSVKGDSEAVAKIITAKIGCFGLMSPASFSPAVNVFSEEYCKFSTWGGIYSDGEKIYYAAGTEKGALVNIFAA